MGFRLFVGAGATATAAGISGTSTVTLDAVTTSAAAALQIQAASTVTLAAVSTAGPPNPAIPAPADAPAKPATEREGNFGWEDLYKDGEWLVPDGTVVTQWVEDDTLPTGKYLKERKWVAPFARADREADYRVAWAFFDNKDKS